MSEQGVADFWESAGRDSATALDDVWSVLVVGDDADAVARAAIGLGRAQAKRRRVAVGDLIGEAPPLQALVRGDDSHGLVDSFLHGVSLNRVARRADDGGNFFILPSGTEPVIGEEVFRSPRWRRLASGFREVGALLVLAAPSSAPGVEDLAESLDGVVLVGRVDQLPAQARTRTIATIAAPRQRDELVVEPPAIPVVTAALAAAPSFEASPPLSVVEGSPATAGDGATAASGDEPGAGPPDGVERRGAARSDADGDVPRQTPMTPPDGIKMGDPRPRYPLKRQPATPWLVPALAGTAVVGLAFYLLHARDRPAPDDSPRSVPAAAAPAATPSGAPPRPDSAMAADLANASGGSTIANPADSANAAAYAIELWQSTSYDGATARVERDWPTLPGVSVTPIVIRNDSVAWYKVRAGAYADSNTAASRRAALRARGGGTLDLPIVRAPYALRIAESVSVDSLPRYARELRAQHVPAYVLLQRDGRANVYAGAFETTAQAAAYRRTLQRLGSLPPIAFRVGDPFAMPRTP